MLTKRIGSSFFKKLAATGSILVEFSRGLVDLWSGIREAVEVSERDRQLFLAAVTKVLRIPPKGPNVRAIPTTSVDSIEQYLAVCQELESTTNSEGKVFFRGQTRDCTLPGTSEISLLPTMARARYTEYLKPSDVVLKAYRRYVNSILRLHIKFTSATKEEAQLFERILIQPGIALTAEETYLHDTPLGKFLAALFMPRATLFQAALQHYGYPTLGLDATYSPLVALYFAMHGFRTNRAGACTPYPTGQGGIVYVLALPEDLPTIGGRPAWEVLAVPTGPRIADLFQLSYDNDSRPRRQYGTMLRDAGTFYRTEDEYCALDSAQPNVYAYYVRHVVRLSEAFWKDASTRRFLESNIGGWFFPDPSVDELLQALRKSPLVPEYDCGPAQFLRHPEGRFEFVRARRIVLTGRNK